MNSEEIIYTPSNEPYLGVASLLAFDNLIIAALDSNRKIAPKTYTPNLNSLQKAACLLIPAGFSLALSIRELIRQGYIYGALVMIRPLAERAMTVKYLYHFPEKLEIWENGWDYRKRPGLTQMINIISEKIGWEGQSNIGSDITGDLNSLIHGDPEGSMWNMTIQEERKFGHSVSKILNRPDLCDKVCKESVVYHAVLMRMANEIFKE